MTRLGVIGFVAAWALALAAPAMAGIQGPCSGSVTIDGITYTAANDTPANPIVVPDQPGLIASWEGSTGVVITDHQGGLGVVVGPGVISLAGWSGENAEEVTEAAGVYPVDQAKELLPVDVVGIYALRGFHEGSGGACTGSAMVEIQGNPLTTPLGAAAAAGTVVSAVGVGVAARGRRP